MSLLLEAQAAWQNECDGWLAFRDLARPLNVQLFSYREAVILLGQEVETRDDAFVLLPPAAAADLSDVLTVLPSLVGGRRVTLRFLADEASEKTAVSHGYVLTARYPVMSAPLANLEAVKRSGGDVHVRQIEGEAEETAVYQLLKRVFQDTMTMTRLFNPPDMTPIFAAFQEDVLVASATLWPFANVAGVFSVATLPTYRKQGVATAVLQQLLAHAHQQGFSHAVLRTIRPLFPVYKPLGFRPVGDVVNLVSRR